MRHAFIYSTQDLHSAATLTASSGCIVLVSWHWNDRGMHCLIFIFDLLCKCIQIYSNDNTVWLHYERVVWPTTFMISTISQPWYEETRRVYQTNTQVIFTILYHAYRVLQFLVVAMRLKTLMEWHILAWVGINQSDNPMNTVTPKVASVNLKLHWVYLYIVIWSEAIEHELS